MKTIKFRPVVSVIFLIILINSCNGQLKISDTCVQKFTIAKELAFSNPTNQRALDSALEYTNECLQCPNIRIEVVEFKVRLLVSMKKYAEGVRFIDSLSSSDFKYGYKQNYWAKGLRAIQYDSENDIVSRNLVYKDITNDIEHYIHVHTIDSSEFNEIYVDLFAIKENYLDDNKINEDVELLKAKYPDRQQFFDFFKK